MSASNKTIVHAQAFNSIENKKEAYVARNMIINARNDLARIKYNKLSARLRALHEEHARLAVEDEAIRKNVARGGLAGFIQHLKNFFWNRPKEIELRVQQIWNELQVYDGEGEQEEDKKGLIDKVTAQQMLLENQYEKEGSNPNPYMFMTDAELEEALIDVNRFCGISLNDTRIRVSGAAKVISQLEEKPEKNWRDIQSEVNKIQDLRQREIIREKMHPLMDTEEKDALLKEVQAQIDGEKKEAEIQKPAVVIATPMQNPPALEKEIKQSISKELVASAEPAQSVRAKMAPISQKPNSKTNKAEKEKAFTIGMVDIVLDKAMSVSASLALQFLSDFVVIPAEKGMENPTAQAGIVSYAKNFFNLFSVGPNLGIPATIVPEPIQGLPNSVATQPSPPEITAGGRLLSSHSL